MRIEAHSFRQNRYIDIRATTDRRSSYHITVLATCFRFTTSARRTPNQDDRNSSAVFKTNFLRASFFQEGLN